MQKENISDLNNRFKNLLPEEILRQLAIDFSGRIVFTTSFGYEDQVITDMICTHQLNIRLVTLDTGRLFEETYKTWRSTLEKYGCEIKAFFPPEDKVSELTTLKGPYSFYESVENRKECCHIRKVIPLARALEGADLWITGLRAQQSAGRSGLEMFEWDEGHRLVKYNPLLNWSLEEVRNYIIKNNVPYNILHDRGFVSIGCAPCTRAVSPGEDFRAGRWWWEQNTGKECGLHNHGK